MYTIQNSNQFNNNFGQRESLNDSDLSYTYIYESIDSTSMKKLQDLNILNNGLVPPEYIPNHYQRNNIKQSISSNSEYTYIYESATDTPDKSYNDKSDYTYVYSYGEYDNDQWTNEYSYTYDEPSAGQINLFQNQQNNELNKALKTRNILFDQNLNNNSPNIKSPNNLKSPNLSISKQPSIFIQRTPKRTINNNQKQQIKKTSPKPVKRQLESPKNLSPHKKSILRKINLLEEQLKYLESSTTMDNDILSTEFTESETKDDPKIKLLQHKLSQITGKNIYNPDDSYSPGNSQYTYTYAYDDTYEKDDEIKQYHSKPKQKPHTNSKQKPRSRSTTRDKPKKLDQTPQNKNANTPTPRTPNLVLQTFNDKAISIFNENIHNEEQNPKNKVDLQISSSIRSEKALQPEKPEEVEQLHSNSASVDSIKIKEKSIELENNRNNEKREKTIKKIYRKIKVNKTNSKHSKKDYNDIDTNPSVYQNSPKTAKSILKVSDDDDELNESEFAALNPVEAKKYTSTRTVDFKGKTKSIENLDNDIIKIKIVEDANVPDVDRFCVFYIEGEDDSVKKTKTVHKGQNKYNENFEFPLNQLVTSKLIIFLKKQDLIKEDKIMGTTKIDLQKVPQNSTLSKWVPLKSDSGVKIESKIHLVLKRETEITERDKIFAEAEETNSVNEHHHHHHKIQSRHKNPTKKKHNKENTFNKNDNHDEENKYDEEKIQDQEIFDLQVETKEAEAQVSLLSESYSEDIESANEENSQISDQYEYSQVSEQNDISKPSNLSEDSYNSYYEEEPPKPKSQNKRKVSNIDKNSYKSNNQEKRKTSNLSEYSNESNHEEEIHISTNQKERKVSNLNENSYKSNHEEESQKSNSQKKRKSSTLDEDSYKSNHEEESQKSNNKKKRKSSTLDEYSYNSNHEEESQKSNNQEKRKSSTHDENSYNSNLSEYSNESNHEEEEEIPKPTNQKERKISDLNKNSHKSNNEEESSVSIEEEESQRSLFNEKSNQDDDDEESISPKEDSNFDDDSVASSLTSFLSFSDDLEREKIKAVGRSTYLHGSSSFNSTISESNAPIKKRSTSLKVKSDSLPPSSSSQFQSDDNHLINSEYSDLSSVQSDFVRAVGDEFNRKYSFSSRSSEKDTTDHKSNVQSRNATSLQKTAGQSNKSSDYLINKNNSRSFQSTNEEFINMSYSLSITSTISESPSLSGPSSLSDTIESRGRKKVIEIKSENDSESERNVDTLTYESDAFNNLVINQLFKEDRIHDFNSSFSETDTKRKRKSNVSSRSVTNVETKRKRSLNDSLERSIDNPSDNSSSHSSPKRQNNERSINGTHSSASASNGSRNANKKVSSLSDSDNLSASLNNEELKISIISQSSKTPKNMPDWQDLSTEDDSLNLNNSNHLVYSKLSESGEDDSLASSSSKKRKSHRSSRTTSSSTNGQIRTSTSINDDDNNAAWTPKANTSKPIVYWTKENS